MNIRLFVTLCVSLSSSAFFIGLANAGQLILKNDSPAAITCLVDGWTKDSGNSFDWQITVDPGKNVQVGQNIVRPGRQVINWAHCGTLNTRAMNITPESPDETLVFNGRQTRVLNAALYPYLPNIPGNDFTTLVSKVVQTYQTQNPDVLLAAQLNPAAANYDGTDIYSFTGLPNLLSGNGLDVLEIDTLYLGFVARGQMINPAMIRGEQPLKVALDASTVDGKLWGVPSWLCMDFAYSLNPDIRDATTLSKMLAFLGKMPATKPQMVADYNGGWRLPSIYINGYIQTYGYSAQAIDAAMNMPSGPDKSVITNLVNLSDTCAFNGTNNCTNNVYHNSSVTAPTEQAFATGLSSADMNFSEQSFYIKYYGQNAPLFVAPGAWGEKPQPLLFSDTYVTNKTTCPAGSLCETDAAAFTTMMTSLPIKNYIVKSEDLPMGTPWRTLLVSAAGFYGQPEIQNNALYQQYARVFQTAQPFPNTFTAEIQAKMGNQVCAGLKALRPDYACKTTVQQVMNDK